MLAVIARARAEGVEIRRELFNSAELQALPALGGDIEQLGLLAGYSAPAALFMPDGMLNPDLPRYLQEASALNALWLKVSLGHFSNNQPLETLRTLLIERGMTLVVENDQTNCGRLAPMQRFEAVCRCAGPRRCSLAGTIGPVADRGPRGVEFPLEGDDLNAVTRHYVNLLRET